MSDRLSVLYAAKAQALARDQAREPLAAVVERGLARRGERRSFRRALTAPPFAFIAEIKRASPSAGMIAADFDPVAIATQYAVAGVDAISVLTEESAFLGDLAYLDAVRAVTACPLLRKDFLSTPYEIAQAAAYGADAVLLIVAGLDDATLRELLAQARRFDLDALVEVHTADELARALAAEADIIGINNRDLRTFTVDLAVTEKLAPQVPGNCVIIAESGISKPAQITRVRAAGAGAALIGEAAMRSGNLQQWFRSMRAVANNAIS